MKKKFILFFLGIAGFFIFLSSVSSETCCEKTINNLICQSGQCNGNYRSSPNSCSEVDFCNGYCIDTTEGTCAPSPQLACGDGQWIQDYDGSLCENGCCYHGDNAEFITLARCNIKQGTWDSSVLINECRVLSQEFGACNIGERCTYTTEEDCISNQNGNFRAGVFCHMPPQHDHKKCFENDVYWFDSEGNREDIVVDCTEGTQMCEESSNGPMCKSTKCVDENNKQRIDGESWCKYDAYVGDSDDVVGSEHCKLYCDKGKIKLENCGEYRTEICSERIYNGISQAKMRVNLGKNCFEIDTAEECEVIPDCRVQNVNVDNGFKFGACVPKYPEGFDIYSESSSGNGEDICKLATMNCERRYWRASDLDDYDCTDNCKCGAFDFIEQMNALCVSIGDCGNSANYEQKITNNIDVSCAVYGGCYYYNLTGSAALSRCRFDPGPSSDKSEEEFASEVCRDYNSMEKPWEKETKKIFSTPNVIGSNTPRWVISERTRGGNADKLALINPTIGDYKQEHGWSGVKTNNVIFTCKPWRPRVGGDNCEKCNNNTLIKCTDYRCGSLGKECEILEETRDTENPLCYDVYEDETEPPIISFGGADGGLTNEISTNGVKIKNSNKECIEKYTKINFTLNTNERSECKWSQARTTNFESMVETFIEKGVYSTEHKIEELSLEFNDKLQMFVRCSDPNENWNLNEYVVDICISPQPDETAAIIDKYSPPNGSYIKKGVTEKAIEIFPHEPAECKYDNVAGKSYEEMTNKMNCNIDEPWPIERKCKTTLKNLIEEQNDIFIKCNDSSGNINTEDFAYTLFSTKEDLKIESIAPNGITRDNPISVTEPLYLEVATSGGAFEGRANCSFLFAEQLWRDEFTETNSNFHKYKITSNLPDGEYNFNVKCEDDAGNKAEANATYYIEIDSTPPIVTRAYKEGGNLKIITNEPATCAYSFQRCNFNLENGTSMTNALSVIHTASLINGQTYYIKCEDLWKNENPSCAIKVKT